MSSNTELLALKPVTSLPPRKRAKTEEEKEQRRIERILRNRRAAHLSREKKRRHVELLETHVSELDQMISILKSREQQLVDALKGAKIDFDVSSLPGLNKLTLETLDLLETNKRSNRKVKLTPKPRPIVLKRRMSESEEPLDQDFENDDYSSDEDMDMDSRQNSMPEIIIKKEHGSGSMPVNMGDLDLDLLRSQETINKVYLSPPISNLDSNSPHSMGDDSSPSASVVRSIHTDDLFMAEPLFDDLDKNDNLFSTNLQIKHEDEDEDLLLTNLPDHLFVQDTPKTQQTEFTTKTDILGAGGAGSVVDSIHNDNSLKCDVTLAGLSEQSGDHDDSSKNGFKLMHHPAAPFNATPTTTSSFDFYDFVLVDE